LGNGESQDDKIPSIMWEKYKLEKGQKAKKEKRVVILKEEKVVRWAVEDK